MTKWGIDRISLNISFVPGTAICHYVVQACFAFHGALTRCMYRMWLHSSLTYIRRERTTLGYDWNDSERSQSSCNLKMCNLTTWLWWLQNGFLFLFINILLLIIRGYSGNVSFHSETSCGINMINTCSFSEKYIIIVVAIKRIMMYRCPLFLSFSFLVSCGLWNCISRLHQQRK